MDDRPGKAMPDPPPRQTTAAEPPNVAGKIQKGPSRGLDHSDLRGPTQARRRLSHFALTRDAYTRKRRLRIYGFGMTRQ